MQSNVRLASCLCDMSDISLPLSWFLSFFFNSPRPLCTSEHSLSRQHPSRIHPLAFRPISNRICCFIHFSFVSTLFCSTPCSSALSPTLLSSHPITYKLRCDLHSHSFYRRNFYILYLLKIQSALIANLFFLFTLHTPHPFFILLKRKRSISIVSILNMSIADLLSAAEYLERRERGNNYAPWLLVGKVTRRNLCICLSFSFAMFRSWAWLRQSLTERS